MILFAMLFESERSLQKYFAAISISIYIFWCTSHFRIMDSIVFHCEFPCLTYFGKKPF